MAKVVITGAHGFVGRHLTKELEEHEYQVIGWDLPDVDITQPKTYENLLANNQPDWLVHLAAISAIPAAEKDTQLTHQVNVVGTRQLLQTITQASPATKILAISSADIYNQPRNVYAQTKWAMEQLIEEKFSDRCIRVRPFPHIGPGQAVGFVTADFASQIAAIEAGQQEPIIKVGNLETKRDFTDVRDVVKAYRILMERGVFGEACPAAERQRGICGVYDIASSQVVSIQQVLNKLLALSPVKITIKQDPARLRPATAPMPPGDTSKLQALGWQPQIPLDQSLKDILEYWRYRGTG